MKAAFFRNDEAQAMAEMSGALAPVRPGVEMATRGADMDIMAELGARGLGAVSMESDPVRALDPALIGYAQLCDSLAGEPGDAYRTEAMTARLAPGEGELPLAAFVAALPRDIPIGLEVPMLARAQARQGPLERLCPAVAAAQMLLNQE